MTAENGIGLSKLELFYHFRKFVSAAPKNPTVIYITKSACRYIVTEITGSFLERGEWDLERVKYGVMTDACSGFRKVHVAPVIVSLKVSATIMHKGLSHS